MVTNELILFLPDADATASVGQKLANVLHAPLLITFSGPLGAGKTALIRALLRALGVQGAIRSPTYTLAEPYTFSNYTVYHFDFYRFLDENEWEESGFRDCFEQHAICLIEWPEKAQNLLPVADLEIRLSYSDQGRMLHVKSHTAEGVKLTTFLKTTQDK